MITQGGCLSFLEISLLVAGVILMKFEWQVKMTDPKACSGHCQIGMYAREEPDVSTGTRIAADSMYVPLCVSLCACQHVYMCAHMNVAVSEQPQLSALCYVLSLFEIRVHWPGT